MAVPRVSARPQMDFEWEEVEYEPPPPPPPPAPRPPPDQYAERMAHPPPGSPISQNVWEALPEEDRLTVWAEYDQATAAFAAEFTEGDAELLAQTAGESTYVVQPGDSYDSVAQEQAAEYLASLGLTPDHPQYQETWAQLSLQIRDTLLASNDGVPLRPNDTLELPDLTGMYDPASFEPPVTPPEPVVAEDPFVAFQAQLDSGELVLTNPPLYEFLQAHPEIQTNQDLINYCLLTQGMSHFEMNGFLLNELGLSINTVAADRQGALLDQAVIEPLPPELVTFVAQSSLSASAAPYGTGFDPLDPSLAYDNPYAVALSLLGQNAHDLELNGPLADLMEEWVPDDRNCASFVTASLAAAGWIDESQYTAGVLAMEGNLRADADWQETSLDALQPGDVVVLATSNGTHGHAVIYAGRDANGNYLYIGSNNVNDDGTQRVSLQVLDPASFTTGFHYQGERGNPNGTADGQVAFSGSIPTVALGPGDNSAAVYQLQSVLVAMGAMTPSQAATGWGIYGPITETAVRRLQATLGVPVTGTYDQATYEALMRIATQPVEPELPMTEDLPMI